MKIGQDCWDLAQDSCMEIVAQDSCKEIGHRILIKIHGLLSRFLYEPRLKDLDQDGLCLSQDFSIKHVLCDLV